MESLIPTLIYVLTEIDSGNSSRITLRSTVSNKKLTRDDESTLYYLTFEILRIMNVIDLYIKMSSSSFSLKKINPKMRSLLRLATFLLKIEKKPIEYINEILEPHYKQIESLQLSTILSSIQKITEPQLYENKLDLASNFSIKYYTPTWIIRKFLNRWDEKFTKDLLTSFLQNLPMYVRVNTLKGDFKQIVSVFEDKNIEYELIQEIQNLIKIIYSETPIPRLPEFEEGKIVIQQKASALVSHVLDPKPGETILDMCASPGGKTSHVAAILGSGENIKAIDINEDRIKILAKRLELLGVESTTILKSDSRTLYKNTNTKFDKILLDPPCSSSGTYSSRPEMKWRLKQRDLRWYTNLQSDLLNSASKLIESEGCIVYSTCSLFQEENHNIISSFLRENTNFSLVNANPILGLSSKLLENKAQELYPHLHETEGFFIAKIKKED
ncbi:MAG: RsmB/NOP family class I SAM-dependent RNA methyltransferase [Candidatus Thorarchaeota archaeon]